MTSRNPGLQLFTPPADPQTTDATLYDQQSPLADRMRPRTLNEYVGQEHVIGPDTALRNAIERDNLPSIILWGPPGTGKTTLASIIARQTGANFHSVSAVSAGVADLRKIATDATALRRSGRRSILFIDEIHRFNKGQQDAILPHVENGTITLIGATTENPSFEINAALLSRSRVFVLHALTDDHLKQIIQTALADPERGLGRQMIQIEQNALATLVTLSNGDARSALGTLEFAAASAWPQPTGFRLINRQIVETAMQQRAGGYDRDGDNHYHLVSAFQKTIRGSDPDAAMYYLARMVEGGEDPMAIARRLVVIASEDVGLADPQALPLAIAAQQALHFIGMPEGYYPLAHATLYLSMAPKSNTVGRAFKAARDDVRTERPYPVPHHLRRVETQLMRELGYGQGYKYAHDAYAAMDAQGTMPPELPIQNNFPNEIAPRSYVEPTGQGDDAKYRNWLNARRTFSPEQPTTNTLPAKNANTK